MSDRSVFTDALETLGTIIDDSQKRDAIHLAVLPIVAGHDLKPGDHIGIGRSSGKMVATKYTSAGLGIVDPFLQETVFEGQTFWMVLYPRTIRSLRHVWQHPCIDDAEEIEAPKVALEETPEMAAARKELSQFAADMDVTLVQLMDAARLYLIRGEYWYHPNGSEGFDGISLPERFWEHYQVLDDSTVPKDEQGNFLACAC